MRTLNSLITALVLSVSSIAAVGCATTGADDYSEDADEAAAAGKFTMWQSTDGQWRFNLKSGNGAILLTSEAYTSRTGALNGILSVQENGVDKAMYAVVPASKGYLLHLKAGNGETIGFSEVYSTKSSATRAVTSSVRAVTTYLDKREAATGARVTVNASETGFSFNFHARNGEVVASSEQYTSEAAALNGAFAVQAEGGNLAAYNVLESRSGTFYFTVQALNGEVVAVSQQYSTRSNAQAGAEALAKLLPTLSVL